MSGNTLPKSIQDNPVLGRWLTFARRGKVGVSSGKVELGQGIALALAQIAAEELDIDLDRIELLSADTDRSPDEGVTAGSQSVEVSGASVRLASAHARAALLQAAAARLDADQDAISCRDGTILLEGEATGLDFWSLSSDVDWQQRVTGNVAVKRVRDYRIVGSSPPRPDMTSRILRGFIHDMSPDGMLHARVVRQPFRVAHIESIDEAWLRQGYRDVAVVRRENFLALVGADEYVVHSAHAKADDFVRWREVPGLWQPAEVRGESVTVVGGSGRSREDQPRPISAQYRRPYLAHASIGPSCALAHNEEGQLTIWTHSQGIFSLRGQIAKCLNLDPWLVRVVHVPGSGCYGHNGADDAALDAAIVARVLTGQPIRVQWSRADELGRGPVGAAMSAAVEAEVDRAGLVAAWRFSVVSTPQAQRPGFGGFINLSSAEAMDSGQLPQRVDDLPDTSGGGASRNSVALYDFPQEVRVRLDTQSRIRTSSLRSLGAHLNVFAIEFAMDELADLADTDPLVFRLRHLTDERCRAVLNGAAEMSGWPGAPPEGHAFGIAAARYKNKGAWLAAVAEVAVDDEVRVKRLWICADAGLLINPDGALNQIEGGAIQAISWTLKEEVRIESDQVPPLDWSSYPILKFSEVPPIETRFIANSAHPSLGTGEASQGPVAAAIGNAASRALGIRLRDLPLTRDRLVSAMMQD